MKKCTKCKIIKPNKAFPKCRPSKDGLYSHCRDCRKKDYVKNRDKILAQKKQYHEANKEKIKEKGKRYCSENKERINTERRKQYARKGGEIRAKRRARYANDTNYREKIKEHVRQYKKDNPEKAKQSHQQWYERNRTQQLVKMREYYKKYPERFCQYRQQYSHKNRDKILKRTIEYRKANPDKRAKWDAKRRAYKSLNNHEIATEIIKRSDIITRDNATCWMCGRGPLQNSEIHLDHLIPLSKGGPHKKDNIKVACIRCNLRKHQKMPEEIIELINSGQW